MKKIFDFRIVKVGENMSQHVALCKEDGKEYKSKAFYTDDPQDSAKRALQLAFWIAFSESK